MPYIVISYTAFQSASAWCERLCTNGVNVLSAPARVFIVTTVKSGDWISLMLCCLQCRHFALRWCIAFCLRNVLPALVLSVRLGHLASFLIRWRRILFLYFQADSMIIMYDYEWERLTWSVSTISDVVWTVTYVRFLIVDKCLRGLPPAVVIVTTAIPWIQTRCNVILSQGK